MLCMENGVLSWPHALCLTWQLVWKYPLPSYALIESCHICQAVSALQQSSGQQYARFGHSRQVVHTVRALLPLLLPTVKELANGPISGLKRLRPPNCELLVLSIIHSYNPIVAFCWRDRCYCWISWLILLIQTHISLQPIICTLRLFLYNQKIYIINIITTTDNSLYLKWTK